MHLMNTTYEAMMSDEHAKERSSKSGGLASHSASARSISLDDNRLDSRDLFSGAREITITHGDDTYRLRLTAQNKLILTK